MIETAQMEDAEVGAVVRLYDELIAARDRLADLPPVTDLDLEHTALAMHEAVFFLLTPPRLAATPLALGAQAKANLVSAARNRDIDTYVMAVALLARKMAHRQKDTPAAKLDAIRDALDALTFDYRRPRRETLAALRACRADLDARIGYASAARSSGYRFQELPEMYAARENTKERPDAFLKRVYGSHIRRGLTQADIRKVDPGFYNVLHAFCSRHERKVSALVPATRTRRD